MPKYHTVQELDCIDSIAFDNGLLPNYIWNHPQNADLKTQRKNPNILKEGDIVYVPDIREKTEDATTDQTHRYVRKSVPAKIEFKVLHMSKPIANAPYTLTIEGKSKSGSTDGDGVVRAAIPPNASKGKLSVFDKDEEIIYELQLGGMDPWDEITGYQKRLENLGYPITPDSYGTLSDGTRDALAQFQADYDLPATGDPDKTTLEKIKELYGN